MTPDAARASYRRALDQAGETILIRRYTGAGTSRPQSSWPVRARVVAYEPKELVGGIVQGDRKLIVLQEDLVAAGFPGRIETGPTGRLSSAASSCRSRRLMTTRDVSLAN